MRKPIYVTQPSLAPLPEFVAYLETVWRTGVMTHNGPLMQRLERELCAHLGVPDMICLANGTCAMQLAMRALNLSGEIITTPFTFIATANIIAWERCTPVFVDIDPATWNLDPNRIEEAITERTVGILPVHVFSAPCDIRRIQQIADKHGLKVVYDAAHAMDVQYQGQSVLNYGDVSCVSFHATKLFNTCEGGGCVARDAALAARLRRMRFFGFNEAKDVVDDGMNAKMTEVSAALGLANLPHLEAVKRERRAKYELYMRMLGECSFVTFQGFDPQEYNYSYMPVVFDSEDRLLRIEKALLAEKVFPRRYFHPSLNTLSIYKNSPSLAISERVARMVLCLPLYSGLAESDIEFICGIIQRC
ncbi:MAG: DegT/DnrJ/EryC1/StrS family aminotransferase [Verrucomicrobia bacterium]|nr:DegT/DnrJ/EryC1/StrS family aminotransferase [Verrucomicrobiota bacterium]